MRTVVAVRHIAFEDLGLLGRLLAARGWTISYQDAWALDVQTAKAADLLVLLGGPIGANETGQYPFLTTEIELARQRIVAERPLLGICLGAQIMARAIGGTIRPGARKEIGWAEVEVTPAGHETPLRHLAGVPVLHWHGEVCELPTSVRPLARTDVCSAQAFAPTDKSLALQFHVEAGADGLEPWLVGHAQEIAAVPGVAVESLRTATRRHGPALAEAGGRMLDAWLASAAP
jgi:GMP synthase (glutamine-hydrolysing)